MIEVMLEATAGLDKLKLKVGCSLLALASLLTHVPSPGTAGLGLSQEHGCGLVDSFWFLVCLIILRPLLSGLWLNLFCQVVGEHQVAMFSLAQVTLNGLWA